MTDTTLESVRGFDVPGGLAYVSFVKDGGGCLVDSDCDDGVFCTVNQCDPVTGECAYDPDDGLCENSEFCDGVEFCDPVAGCQTAEVPDCDDDIDCTLDVCNEVSDECDHTPDHESCSDGLFCNGQEQCDKERGCWAGPLPFCVDRADCTLDSCNEDTDSCDHLPNDGHCDDGFYCTGIEFCDVDWGCQDGDPPCLSGEVCDEIEGCLSAEFLTLDIRPGSCRNPFNPKSRGVLPVALLGTPDFDLSLVDIETMVLTRSDGAGEVFYVIDGPGRLRPVLVDMGTPVHGDSCDCDQSCDCGGLCGCSEPLPDGYLDLLLKFSTHSVTAVLGSVESGAGDSVVLAVSGNFLDGSPFSAVDCVSIVPSSSVISSRGKISRRDP